MSARLDIVTLDGPAGVGKTTIARLAARELGWAYLDTGAMFRAVAFQLGDDNAALDGINDIELERRLAKISFALHGAGEASRLDCNGQELGQEIRTEEVAARASSLAKRVPVRQRLKEQQQKLGRSTALVVEGRDMGTVVFPEAKFKFFLDASPEVRARRRFLQLKEAGQLADLEKLAEQIRQRDEQDRTRTIAPLKPAEDALVVDTGGLGIEEVLGVVLAGVQRGG